MLFSFCFTFNLLIIKKKRKNVPKTQWQFSATILLSSAILIGQPRTFPKIYLMHEINQLLLYSWNQRYSMWERANAAEQWSLLSFLCEALLNSHRIERKVLCYVMLKTTKLNLGKKLLFLVCTPFFFFFWQLPTLSWNA